MRSEQLKVILIFPTPEGSREFTIENGELQIGRGAVDLQFNDNSLSRHHATIFRDNDRVWILDERSTNGSFVNEREVAPNGTPLKNGDEIRLGNETVIRVKISEAVKSEPAAAPSAVSHQSSTAQTSGNSSIGIAPLIIACAAVFVIGLALIVVASQAISFGEPNNSNEIAARTTNDEPEDLENENTDDENKNENRKKPKPSASATPADSNANSNSSAPDAPPDKPRQPVAPAKTYEAMSATEKSEFIKREAVIVARMIGNRSGEDVPPEAVERIKSFVDAYAKRLKYPKLSGECNFTRADLQTMLERAAKNAQFIVPAFNSEGLAPQIGLYLAMIESEHCVCLQSPTGPLGMFQFTRATGANFGLATRVGASPTNPDERCEPQPAAKAAAKYMKFLAGRYGTGPLSFPLAIASYNSGEGGLSTNLQKALAESNEDRSFWTLVANQGKLSEQFQKENVKYVPKFFAAAIVGENPTVFGVNQPPLSSNTK